jgi:hypothetical protein
MSTAVLSKPLSRAVVCLLLAAGPAPLARAQSREEKLEEEVWALKERVQALEKSLEASRTADGAPPVDGTGAGGTPASLRGVYDKPFLADLARQAQFGGYTEFEYHSFEDGILGIPEGFRMHRTNLFFFADVLDRVRFGSEIEFETEFEGAPPSSDIEVAVEMAFIDWALFEELNIRGGAILVPLGRINVNHDGPIRELTERPLVSTFVIPTTLTEAGVGAHGKFAATEDLSFRYELYAVNGFNLLSETGELAVDTTEQEQLLREGRTSLGGDINSGIASTGRLSAQILRRFEIGGSWHVGTYDENGDNILAIIAGDMAYERQIGDATLGLEGEIATAEFERDDFARAAGVPERFWGFYAQASVGGMPEVFRSVPHVFDGQGSRLGLVLRYDWVDLDGDLGDTIEPGLTFRPVTDTVFKFSYKFTQRSIGLRNVPGRSHFEDDGFVFSLSTYF